MNNQKYKCWFLINPHKGKSKVEELEKQASDIFLNFIEDKNYGIEINSFRFDITIENKVNYELQRDSLFMGLAHLSAHIDKKIFEEADETGKIKLLLNASSLMIKYLAKKMTLPKTFQSKDLFNDYRNYLAQNNFFLKQDDKTILKQFDPTEFKFLITSSLGVREDNIYYNLNEIQRFINSKLSGQTFGTSIKYFYLGYEIFDFTRDHANFMAAIMNLKRFGKKLNYLLMAKKFDYNQLKDLVAGQQFKILKDAIIEAINDVDLLDKKPKDFNKPKFLTSMDKILTLYEKKFIDQE
ncbi:hypothetical protein [Flavobacterium sp.]|uniref:hypothetical protein n=1 Tax=Flavobacterium sp. TaxID=239 RepID=UPI003D0B2C48